MALNDASRDITHAPQLDEIDGNPGLVVWFVGLSGAGKTTLAKALYKRMYSMDRRVVLLDGDEIRQGLCRDLGFSDEDRSENIRRIAEVARLMSRYETSVIVATISPLPYHRELMNSIVPRLLQVFVDAPLSVCERRDPKGLYALARAGVLEGFTGVHSPFIPPEENGAVCSTVDESVNESLEKVLHLVVALSPNPSYIRYDIHNQ